MANLITDKIRAGLTFQQRITLTAYQPPEWRLILVLRGVGAIDMESVPDGAQHLLSSDAPTTSTWPAGWYGYSLRVTDGSDVYELEAGTLEIVPDLAAVTAGTDARSHVIKTLAAIEAVIESRATKDQESYKINNRELRRTPIADLLTLRSHYQAELRRINAAQKGQSLLGRQVLARF